MSDVDGWAEAVDFIDEDDVKRWAADKKMDPQKFKEKPNHQVMRLGVGTNTTYQLVSTTISNLSQQQDSW